MVPFSATRNVATFPSRLARSDGMNRMMVSVIKASSHQSWRIQSVPTCGGYGPSYLISSLSHPRSSFESDVSSVKEDESSTATESSTETESSLPVGDSESR